MTDELTQVRDDALDILRDMLDWSMTPASWAEAEAILDRLGSAPSLADPDELARLSDATIALELAAPPRITKIDKSAVPVPDQVRERVNQLIHELARPAPPADPQGETKAGK
jgi:hypothetical protein